jgi:predicted RND superfamily exporter protein
MLSEFKMNYILGALSALTIALALLIDFTLLPAVLSFSGGKKTISNKQSKSNRQ